MTPTLSVALDETSRFPLLSIVEEMVTFGGVVSLTTTALTLLLTLIETEADVPTFVAASDALELKLWAPLANVVVSRVFAYGEVVAVATTIPSIRKSTLVTPTLSEAEADIVIVPDTVAPLVGDVILVLGSVRSALLTVTEIGVVLPTFPAAS